MKFIYKPKDKPSINDIRKICYFSILPIKISNEIRWLENVCVKQKFVGHLLGGQWVNLEFIDN